jgi:thiaminase/transcriptional activator TenA
MARRFTDELRRHAAGGWRRMQEHRFVIAIEEDGLPEMVLRRYLINEYAFVETAIAIFGYALIKAPDIATKRQIACIITALANDQVGYFEAAFAKLGMAEEEWRRTSLPPKAAMLRDGMLGYAAHGSFADVATAMLAAEWTYHTFCDRAAARTISNPVLRDWVLLHSEPAFAGQTAWLRTTVDQLAAEMPAAGRRRLADVFATALELEIQFHDAPFEEAESERWPRRSK